ncbi:YhgE/Pip domain-containing protein [Deinococcus koreensis]|uniref:YhgE/Pip domain-containing protein n=1 Tax=Deinococcus koreensis TaxID=2054903 RepID=A0A2K3UZC7_9DEIO|nr:YhgE/Pip domain-containing protein [Deinococcus koreensis]PNY81881.1 YhgE/Pip domain-containing protein [Deinococcus koreensis]
MPSLRSLQADYRLLSPAERSLWRHPMMWLSAAAISAVPLLYATIYLSSSLDPYGRLEALPVALVNLDQGATARGPDGAQQRYELGAEVIRDLTREPKFHYLSYPSQQAAQDAVRRGKAYFALTIPATFSKQSLAGESRDHGTLNFYVAEGSNYFASRVAATFATTLSDELNRTLGETRWEIVQRSLKQVDQGFADIRRATGQLADGAAQLRGGTRQLQYGAGTLADGVRRAADGGAELEGGAGRLSGSVAQLTDGTGRLSGGLRQLEAAAPGRGQLAPLQAGAAQLSGGAGTLADGLGKLSAGANELSQGAQSATTGAQRLAQGTAQLAAQAPQLQSGLARLSAAGTALAGGARSASSGAADLAAGGEQLASRLPTLQSSLGQLADGAAGLSDGAKAASAGAQRLAEGSGALAGQLSQLQGGLEAARQGAQRANASAANFALLSGQLNSSLKSQVLVPAQVREDVAKLEGGALQLQGGTSNLNVGLPKFAAGARQASVAARQLQTGAAGLAGGAARLDSGAQALAGGLTAAQEGSEAAVQGARSLGTGTRKLAAGTAQVADGASTLAARVRDAQAGAAATSRAAQQLSAGAAALTRGTGQLQTGGATLARRAAEAASGARSLQSGAKTLQSGVNTLVDGNVKIKEALGQITRQLPAPADLGALKSGANTLAQKTGELRRGLGTLADGSDRLRRATADVNQGAGALLGGLRTLQAKVPQSVGQISGDPAGLSVSVRPETQVFAAVKNNGAAFAPYFMALSLWVGVTLTTFIFPYSQLPRTGRRTSQLARMARKAATPALLVVLQALLVVWGVQALGVDFLHPAQVLATAIASSLTFLALVLALIFCLGAAGRLLALILLVLQLAASGGSYPVELAPPFFQTIHNWLPVTQSVNALRHALSGAFQGGYPGFMLSLLAIAALSVGLGLLGRRWEFVDDEDFKPLISAPIVSQELHHDSPQDAPRDAVRS